ncbi:MAG: hypothetical protein SGI89_15770 [bacterium]|nr:hypothetical protein [bacterium]
MNTIPYILLTITIFNELDNENSWIARCNELGTSTFGDSFDEVAREIQDLILLHLNSLEETGERLAFFKENSIEIRNDVIPEYVESKPVRLNEYSRRYAQPLLQPA